MHRSRTSYIFVSSNSDRTSPALSREAGRLPDFLLIGAAKAGTTALFAALARHPYVYASPTKEPRFLAYVDAVPSFKGPGGAKYASTIVVDAASYRSLFAGCPENARAGEASTDYLGSESAPDVARRLVPQARIIAVLRHPVERAYSHFLHLRQHGHEPVPDFEAAWMDESRRAAAGWRPSHLYQRRGFYGQQLTRWLGHFPTRATADPLLWGLVRASHGASGPGLATHRAAASNRPRRRTGKRILAAAALEVAASIDGR